MGGRRVPLVPLEVEGGVGVRRGPHDPVTRHLGQHRRRRHRRTAGITSDHGVHGRGPRRPGPAFGGIGPSGGLDAAVGVEELRHQGRAHKVERAVEHHRIGDELGGQLFQGPASRQPERGGHAHPVALLGPGVPDSPTRTPRRHLVEDRFAGVLGELLGVAQSPGDAWRGLAQHHHADAERPGPGPAPDFVHARHQSVAGIPQTALVDEARSGRNRPPRRLQFSRLYSRNSRRGHRLTPGATALARCCPCRSCGRAAERPSWGPSGHRRQRRSPA